MSSPTQRLARAAQQSAAYRDLPLLTEEQLFEVAGLAAVTIETRVPDLLAAAARAIGAGKHIHLEKPGGASLPRFRGILDTAARKHLAVQMGYSIATTRALFFCARRSSKDGLARHSKWAP